MRLLCSIFPEKVIFDGEKSRTTKINELLRLSLLVDKGFVKKKTRQLSKNLVLSGVVVPVGERSYYEVDDFHKILEFTGLLEPLTD